jgi:hypothetical protein
MIYTSNGKALNTGDADSMTAFFLLHMTQEQRFLLMAEQPALYARVFPEVREETILARVLRKIQADKDCPEKAR